MTDLQYFIRLGRPAGADTHYGGIPEPGTIIAVKRGENWGAWRVVETGTVNGETAVRVRPMRLDGHPDPVRAAATDRHFSWPNRCIWYELPEHYPVCRLCSELVPCRHVVLEHQGKVALDRMDRYDMPGVCPACKGPVTQRQASRTFDVNLHVPGGPPVTFHLRKACAMGEDGALAYEQKVNKSSVAAREAEERP